MGTGHIVIEGSEEATGRRIMETIEYAAALEVFTGWINARGGTVQHVRTIGDTEYVTAQFPSLLDAAQWVAAWRLQNHAHTLASRFDAPVCVTLSLKIVHEVFLG
jgi:hypothetical protein